MVCTSVIAVGRRVVKSSLILLLAAPFLAGCANQIVEARNTGQTQTLVASAAGGGIDYSSLDATDHYLLCTVLLNARHFAALDECVRLFEKRSLVSTEEFTSDLVAIQPGYFESGIALMKAQRSNDLGEYDKAVLEAEKAIKIGKGNAPLVQVNSAYSALTSIVYLGLVSSPNDTNSPYQKNLRRILLAQSYGILATAQNGSGDRAGLENTRNALKAIYNEENKTDQNPLIKNLQHSLASTYFVSGDYEQSYDWLTRDDRSALFQFIDGFAEVYLTIGVLATPVSEAIAQAVAGASVSDLEYVNQLPFVFQLCVTLLEVGKSDEAQPCFENIIKDPRSKAFGDYRFGSNYGLARIALDKGDRQQAITYLEQAVVLAEGQRQSIITEQHKLGFISDKQDVYRLLIEVLLETGDQVRALEYVERAKSRALIDLLAARDSDGEVLAPVRADSQDAGLAGLLQELQDIEQQERIGLPRGERGVQSSEKLRQVVEQISESNSKALPLVQVEKPDFSKIGSYLGPDEVMLIYYGDNRGLYGFLFDGKGVTARQLESDGLDKSVEILREQIDRKSGMGYRAPAKRLHDRLIAPFADEIAGKSLVIVPHGKLHYLPFAALYGGSRHLIETHTFRILPSASVLDYLDHEEQATPSILALGNPALNDPVLDLPGAEQETRTIVSEWPKADMFLRAQATETTFKSRAGNHGVIHLASHGVFDSANPLASRLLLAPDASNDGVLSVREIYDLSLNADMVTLSACETGLGEIANGDDIIGLTRGFFFAGADSVVSSLWTVSDASTEVLMKSFYRNLQSQNKPEALRGAILETATSYGHPFYWSAFQVSGAR